MRCALPTRPKRVSAAMKPMSRNGLDPACGSGNFLIVAYRELRQLELDILIRLQELGDTSAIPTLYFERSDLAVKLTNVAGIEIEEWPAQIARTALRLVDHLANMAMEAALGKAPDTLPLDTVQIIHVGNALRMDWSAVMPPQPGLMVVGNPPFLGHATRRPEQADELRDVWGRKDIGRLDYVTGWFKKSSDYLGQTPGVRFAFVSTNSIAQSEPVPTLFAPIFEADWRIRFAHQTFAWTSEAAGAAAVHCVITGFDREPRTPAKLYTYASLRGEPTEVYVSTQINAYLTEGANVLVEQRRDVLGAGLPTVSMGSMPRDGGNLLINTGKECNEVCADPIAANMFVRSSWARNSSTASNAGVSGSLISTPAMCRGHSYCENASPRLQRCAESPVPSPLRKWQLPRISSGSAHSQMYRTSLSPQYLQPVARGQR